LRPSPIVALNRAIAVGLGDGAKRGLEQIHAITGRERLARHPFYFAAMGELELRCGSRNTACEHFRAALTFARNPMEHRFLNRRMNACESIDAWPYQSAVAAKRSPTT
jgi:RNA polymerase sigma-70 factor (ECF subfamily)